MDINDFLKQISLENEEWKPVKNFEDFYRISNCGRLCSVGGYRTNKNGTTRWFNPVLISIHPNKAGYDHHTLYVNNARTEILTHRLVAEAFVENPDNKIIVDHIDGNKLNNHASNLRWTTVSENMKNPNTQRKQYVRVNNSHLFDTPVISIDSNNTITKYNSMSEAEKEGFNRSGICMCCRGRRKTHGGLRWMYLSDYEKLQNSNS